MDGIKRGSPIVNVRPGKRMRTVFVSLPDEPRLRDFVENSLSVAIKSRYTRLEPVSYLGLRQGQWLPQIEKGISYSNAVIAFIKDLNSNVLLEVGRAMALGKPVILVAPSEMKIPSMLNHQQIIKYKEEYPNASTIERIATAIELAVFTILHREKSDERIRIQKRLLLGAELPTKRRPRLASPSKTGSDIKKLLEKAIRLYESADFGGSVEILEECIANGMTTEEVFHLLADTWFLNGEASEDELEARNSYEEHLRVAEKGLEFFPASFSLRKDRGLALIKLERYWDAEDQFNQLAEQGDFSVVHYDLACVNALIGNKIRSLRHLERSIQMESFYQELARVDPDFDPIWEDAMFQALIFQARI